MVEIFSLKEGMSHLQEGLADLRDSFDLIEEVFEDIIDHVTGENDNAESLVRLEEILTLIETEATIVRKVVKKMQTIPEYGSAELYEMLKELVALKHYKTQCGKDEVYMSKQPLLWDKATKLLNQF